jgi:predicted HTH domain antitoxin
MFVEIVRRMQGVLLAALGVYLLISVSSYSPRDRAALDADAQLYNFGGQMGAYIAHGLRILFGRAAYLIALLPILMAVSRLRHTPWNRGQVSKMLSNGIGDGSPWMFRRPRLAFPSAEPYDVYNRWRCKQMRTVTISMRLAKTEVERLERLAAELGIERPTLLKRALRRGAEDLMFERATQAYRSGEATLSRAADLAGLSLRDMILRLKDANLELNYGVEDLEKDLHE